MEGTALAKMKGEVGAEEGAAEEGAAEASGRNAADNAEHAKIGDGKNAGKRRKAGWLWPLGVLAGGVAGVGLVVLRGCWHRRLSWPVRAQGHSYQVCLGCGAKRLFDEKGFRAYGPFRYDLNELIAWKTDKHGDAARKGSRRPA